MPTSSGKEDITGHQLQKCPRGSPTCLTPHQCQKRVPLREISAATNGTVQPRRLSNLCLSSSGHQLSKDENWNDAELKVLVQFILFHTTGDNWPTHKQKHFASDFISSRSGITTKRSGMCTCIYVRACNLKLSLQQVLAGVWFSDA